MRPTLIRLEPWHETKIKLRMKERNIKSKAEYIRNLIDNDK